MPKIPKKIITMNKRELIILLILIFIFVAVNVVNYIKRVKLKENYTVLVEEITVQISINDAGVSELENLTGIGPSLANKIMEYRKVNGRFKKLESLKNVKGIGDKLFQRILPYIKL